jgi:hypothetical protein
MLSVVIATQNSERLLLPTLAALVSGAAAGLVREVIIADGQSRDRTLEIADIAGCRMVASADPLATRLRTTAAGARAGWLMFLRPGIVPDRLWADETMRFIEASDGSQAAVFRPATAPAGERPLIFDALALLRAALGGRPRPEQGLVIAKSLYESLGGHRDNEANPESALIGRLGRRIVILRSGASVVAMRRSESK